jgi:hypothetical protein
MKNPRVQAGVLSGRKLWVHFELLALKLKLV